MILSWDKPRKLQSTAQHNDTYQSDSGVAGTYVPNMSQADKLKWKAKHIKGEDPRVEIRKTVGGTQVLIVVRLSGIRMSANGPMLWTFLEWGDLQEAKEEALEVLVEKKSSRFYTVEEETKWSN